MTTITLKIKEKTKKGKIFLDLAKMFYAENNEVELMETPVPDTIVKEVLTAKDKKYLKNLKNVVIDIKEGQSKNFKTWQEFSNDL